MGGLKNLHLFGVRVVLCTLSGKPGMLGPPSAPVQRCVESLKRFLCELLIAL